MVINPFIWTADELLMLGKVLNSLTNELKVLDITHRGPPGVQGGAILDADLTKNLIFQPFGPPEWSSTPSFGLLTGF